MSTGPENNVPIVNLERTSESGSQTSLPEKSIKKLTSGVPSESDGLTCVENTIPVPEAKPNRPEILDEVGGTSQAANGEIFSSLSRNDITEVNSVSPEACTGATVKRKASRNFEEMEHSDKGLSVESTLSVTDQISKRSRIGSEYRPIRAEPPISRQTSIDNTNNGIIPPGQILISSMTSSLEPLLAKNGQPETSINTSESGQLQSDKLDKKQKERLAKQKLREQERIARERKNEEERQQKKQEREKKGLERKQKKEIIEKEKQEKREQERLKREQKRLQVENERNAKEEERRLKEEERRRAEEAKERSQMKIMNFFTVKSDAQKDTSKENDSRWTPSAGTSLGSTQASSLQEVKKASLADSYSTDFLPFFQKRNVLLAHQSQLPPDLLASSKKAFDAHLEEGENSPNLGEIFTPSAPKAARIVTSSQKMVDALNSCHMTESSLYDLVRKLPPIKYLQFYENAKPPYVGTWCSEKHLLTALPPNRPLDTTMTGYDYNYDSDLDWQEGDEGDEEDIDDLDEGDEEEDEAEEDEMEDFVDNSEMSKRGAHRGPLQSVSIWNDGTRDDIFDNMKYERLHLEIDYPIDPFKDYWSANKELKPVVPIEVQEKSIIQVSQLGTPVKSDTVEKSQMPNVLTPQKPIIKDEKVVESLVEFIKKNSDFSIGTLSELARKEYKVYTKSLLKHTIQEIAFYNKKTSSWEIKQEASTVA